jgi:uncharacterized protein DUF1054
MDQRATLGFTPTDFEVFTIKGFGARMEKIYEHVRPKLTRLGIDLALELSRKLHLQFFPHVAKHMRHTADPPPETWVAFGPSPRGYKRYGYLALCISRAGLHARAVVGADADSRPEMAARLTARSAQLVKDFAGTKIARYEKWDFARLPAPAPADLELFGGLSATLGKKTGSIDIGFGWSVRDSLRLERAEMIEAFRELEPLYRIFLPSPSAVSAADVCGRAPAASAEHDRR